MSKMIGTVERGCSRHTHLCMQHELRLAEARPGLLLLHVRIRSQAQYRWRWFVFLAFYARLVIIRDVVYGILKYLAALINRQAISPLFATSTTFKCFIVAGASKYNVVRQTGYAVSTLMAFYDVLHAWRAGYRPRKALQPLLVLLSVIMYRDYGLCSTSRQIGGRESCRLRGSRT